jgi:PAS domain S-box-containing protein
MAQQDPQSAAASSLSDSELEWLKLKSLALESSSTGIVIVDCLQPDQPITFVNAAFESITGYSAAEVLGRNCRFLQGTDTEQPEREVLRRAIAESKDCRIVIRNYRKDGSLFWNELEVHPVIDPVKGLTHYTGSCVDVTARLESQRELKLSEERFRLSQEYAGLGTWDWDIATGDLYWSAQVRPLFGIPEEARASYELFLSSMPPEDRTLVEKAVGQTLDTGAPYEVAHRIIRPDGSLRWVKERGGVIRDETGRAIRMLGVVYDITDKRLTDEELRLKTEALRENEERLADAQRIAHVGNWELELASGKLIWSDEIYRIFGQDPSSYTPSHEAFIKSVHPDDLAALHIHDAKAMAGEPYHFIHRIVRPDGTVRHVQEFTELNCDAQGKPVCLRGVVQDITELTEAERASSESQLKLNSAQRLAHVGSWELDLETGGCAASDELYAILGGTPAELELSADKFIELTIPEDQPAMKASQEKALREGKSDTFLRIRTNAGEIRHLHQLCETVYDSAGRPALLRGTTQDITQLIATEREARRQAELSRVLMENVYDAIMVATPDGVIVAANDKAQTLTGYPKEQLIGLRVVDLHPADEVEAITEFFQALAEKGAYRGQTRMLRADGKIVPVDVTAATLNGGNDPRFLGMFRDISIQLEREKALLEAKEAAERANRAKSEFLSNMSHELRTPLNSILGFSQLILRNTLLPVGDKENAHEINRAGKHLLRLINDILDLSRIESGQLDLNLGTVSVDDVLDEAFTLVAPLAARGDVRLERQDGSSGYWVTADATRLKQIVLNLLANAIKYTRPGGRVTLKAGNKVDHRLRIEVADTGVGIKPEYWPEMFKPFSRLGSPADVEGTGIGLVLSKRMAEAMSGSMGFESHGGTGSTFWVELPLVDPVREAESTTPEATGAAALTSPAEQARVKVLYVEDTPANLRLVAKLIAGQPSWLLIPAPTPELGLELAAAHQPDIVLLDINLPGMDGYTLLARMRELPGLERTPVVAISANASARDLEKGRLAGFDEYLTKPLDVDLFEAVMTRLAQQVAENKKTTPPG